MGAARRIRGANRQAHLVLAGSIQNSATMRQLGRKQGGHIDLSYRYDSKSRTGGERAPFFVNRRCDRCSQGVRVLQTSFNIQRLRHLHTPINEST